MAAKKTVKSDETEVKINALEDQTEELDEENSDYEDDEEEEATLPAQSFYDNDGDEVLFPDGPKMNLVEEWKSKYGAVYLTEFDEEVFLWRTLTRKEYKDIMKVMQADTYYKEERICDKCILYPEGYDFLKMTHGKAGIPSLLAEQIMDKSGFTAKVGAVRV
jgi:hypothetical protein